MNPTVILAIGRKGMPLRWRMGYKLVLSIGMNMMMVNASMFPNTSFGIPWSSSTYGKLTLCVLFGLEQLPIDAACETKLFSIWEKALSGLISQSQQAFSNLIRKRSRYMGKVTYTQ